MAGVRAVVFDFFGTLTVDQTAEDRSKRQALVADLLGIPQETFVVALRHSFTARATGAWGSAEEALGHLCATVGVHPSQDSLQAAAQLRQEAERWLARPRPGSLELLAALRAAGIPTGVLSDCTAELVTVWPDLPYASLTDAAVFSVQVGVRKPALAMYSAICRKLQVMRDSVVYVGDGGSQELSGATRAGMRPIMIRESLDEAESTQQLRYDAEPDWQGERVSDMTELAQVLAGCGLLPVM